MKERSPQVQAAQRAPASSANQPGASVFKERRRRWIVTLCLLLVLAAFHGSLLRWAVNPLVAEGEPGTAENLFIYSGDGRFARAAEACRRGDAMRLLLLDGPATRLVRLGILPSRVEECRRELARSGVSDDAVEVIPGKADTPWQTARCLGAWLREHPREDVLVVCDRFASGDLRYVMSRLLEASEQERVAILAIADRRYDEANWWRSRPGWLAVGEAACQLAYDRLRGEDANTGTEFDLEAFERSLP